MRPLVVFTGQGVCRADGLNLTRRLRSVAHLRPLFRDVPWRNRLNLDELIEAAGTAGAEGRDAVIRELRSICFKERRSTDRKDAHRAFFQTLAEHARHRLVLHLTTNIDSLTSIFAVRDFGGCWEPLAKSVTLSDVRESIAGVLEARRGLVHLPVHGEAALVCSPGDDFRMRTFYGDPAILHGAASSVSTLECGLARGVGQIEETLPLARVGYGLLRATLAGNGSGSEFAPILRGQPPANLVAIGYGAGGSSRRMTYPFERVIDEIAARRSATARRFSAVVFDAPESRATIRWYSERGFNVALFGEGEFAAAARTALSASHSELYSDSDSSGLRAAPVLTSPARRSTTRRRETTAH